MKGKIELKTWENLKQDPPHEDHFKVLLGRVLIESKDYSKLIPAGRGLRIAWPYTVIAYEKSVIEYL